MATAATAPVRSAVTERTSASASGRPSAAMEMKIAPITTGRPAAGFRGNDVTHLRMASPPPRAGMARKSPPGRRRPDRSWPASPSARAVLLESVAHLVDRFAGRDGRQHRRWSNTGISGTGRGYPGYILGSEDTRALVTIPRVRTAGDWRLVRRTLGLTAFGVNVVTIAAGEQSEHDETDRDQEDSSS